MQRDKKAPFATPDISLPTFAELDRRGFLTLAGKSIGFTALLGVLPGCGGSSPDTGIPAGSLELHVLKRTSFGASGAALASIQSSGVKNYLEQQLNYTAIDASGVEAEVAARFPLAHQTHAELSDGLPGNFQAIVDDLVGATLLRAYTSPQQLYEVMVEFWTNHFSIHLLNGQIPLLKPTDDFAVIRPHALGTFSDLLHASAKSPAMLYYLDNFLNVTGEPQENYARELLELHTVGDGNFSEDDVKEVARCFTGWSFYRDDREFNYRPDAHDNGAKTVLGNFIPEGGGVSDGETVIDILAAHPATARHIATKLCRRFVADVPPDALIDAVAAQFTATSGNLVEVLRTLFATPEFLASNDQKFARPMEFIGQLVRGLDGGPGYPDDDAVRLWFAFLTLLGQAPFYWVPPNGYPDVSDHWSSTSGFLNRWRIALALDAPEVQALLPVQQLSAGATTIATTVDAVSTNLLHRELAQGDRQLIIDWLTEFGVDADVTLPPATIDTITPLITALLASSAYFQLR